MIYSAFNKFFRPEMSLPENDASIAPTNANDLDAEDSLHVMYAGAKRRIAMLEQELQTLRESGPK